VILPCGHYGITPFFTQAKMFPLLTCGSFFHYTRVMSEKTPITDLIDTWKPRQLLADEIGANLAAVHKWASANRIPSDWQAPVVRAAQAKGLTEITGNWMVSAHSRERSSQ
jgi:hypothetical protein